jgi:hypothetical protein
MLNKRKRHTRIGRQVLQKPRKSLQTTRRRTYAHNRKRMLLFSDFTPNILQLWLLNSTNMSLYSSSPFFLLRSTSLSASSFWHKTTS